jgi:hypothetical protein
MEPNKTPETPEKVFLTNEQIEKNAQILSNKYGVEVKPFSLIDPETGDQIVGYLKQPIRALKMKILDKSITSPMFAASELLDACLIVEESSPRILSEDSRDDKINLGASLAAMDMIKVLTETYKKK